MEHHAAVKKGIFGEHGGPGGEGQPLKGKKGFMARPAKSLSYLRKQLLFQTTQGRHQGRVVGDINGKEDRKLAHRKYRMTDRISIAQSATDLPLSPRKQMKLAPAQGFLSSSSQHVLALSKESPHERQVIVYERKNEDSAAAVTPDIDPHWALQQMEEKFAVMEDISFSYVSQTKRVKLKPCLLDVIHCYDTFFLKMSTRSNFISKSKLTKLLTKEGLMAEESIDMVSTFILEGANPFAETIDFAGFMEQYVHYKIFLCIRALAQSFYHDTSDVTREQLLECFEDQLGKRRAILEVNSCFDLVDSDGNGTLDMEEIAVWYMTKEKEMEKAKRDREVTASRITHRSKLTDENIILSRVFEEFPDPSRLSSTQLARLWREYELESGVQGFLEDGTYHIFSQKYLDIINDELIPVIVILLEQFAMSQEVLHRAEQALRAVIESAPIDAISHDFDKYFQRYKVDDLKVSKQECMLGLATALTENAAISELFLKIETLLEHSFEWSYVASYIFEEQWVDSEESADVLAEMIAILRESVEPGSLRLLWLKQSEIDEEIEAEEEGAEVLLSESQVHKVVLQLLGLLVDTVAPQLHAVLRDHGVDERLVSAFENDVHSTIGSLFASEGVLSRALVLDLRACFSRGPTHHSQEHKSKFITGEQKFFEKRRSIYITPTATEMAMSRLKETEAEDMQCVEPEINEWEKLMRADHGDDKSREREYGELRISLEQLLPLFDLRALCDPNCMKDMLSKLTSQVRRVLKSAFDEGEDARKEEDDLAYQRNNNKNTKDTAGFSLKKTSKVIALADLQAKYLEDSPTL
jgi:hypothetical protein